jgi:hypothetical protein
VSELDDELSYVEESYGLGPSDEPSGRDEVSSSLECFGEFGSRVSLAVTRTAMAPMISRIMGGRFVVVIGHADVPRLVSRGDEAGSCKGGKNGVVQLLKASLV